jgi:cbb3-type cytochrome oxidase subunit 3
VELCAQNGVTLVTSTVAPTASSSAPVTSASAVTVTGVSPGSVSISTVLEPAASMATMTATNFPQSSGTPSNSQSLSSGTIAGIAVGAVVIVLMILSLRLWLLVLIPRRKKRAAEAASDDADPREGTEEVNAVEKPVVQDLHGPYHVERQELEGSAASPADLSQRAELDGRQIYES